ncbi:tetratricopeptide repeat protein [Candidatus Babeliales bacterium]|nr:tetratricopeptide repeat protein [Candidatus Babeliales bacterium]
MSSLKFSWWQITLPPILLSIISAIIYYPSLYYGFFFDDEPTIIKNIGTISSSQSPFTEIYANNRWVSRFLNALTYKYWQNNPFGYRIINLAIHITIGILIFFLIFKLLSSLKNSNFLQNFLHQNALLISTITSALFLLHPVQTQTATYITQMRLEGTVVLFTFLVLFFFSYAALSKNIFLKIIFYALSIFFTSIAAGTKEIIIVLPILVLLVDWFFIAPNNLKKFFYRLIIHALIFISLFGTFAKFRWRATDIIKSAPKIELSNHRGNVITEKPTDKITIKPFFISQFKVILHYITMFFWPYNITFDYEYKLSKTFWDRDTFYPFLILVFLLLTSLFLFIKNFHNFISFCILWSFVCILPRASIIPATELVCDYKTYLASFGILLFIAILLAYLINFLSKFITNNFNNFLNIESSKVTQPILLLLIISTLSLSTKKQNLIWSSDLAFWQDAVKKSPSKARLWNNYAAALADTGQEEKAIENYKIACQLDQNYAEPVINLAFHYQAKGQKEIALKYYEKALNLSEMHPEMYLNLGILHFNDRNYTPAENCFKTAIALRPYYSYAHFNLARIYIEENKLELASQHLENAIIGDKKDLEYFYLHGTINYKLGNQEKVISSLEFIAQNNINYKNIVNILAHCYYEMHNYNKASYYFEIIYNKDPKNNINAYNLAQAFLNSNQYEKALPFFEQCKSDLNNFPYAPLHFANCLNLLGKKEEAKQDLICFLNKIPVQQVKLETSEFLKNL